MLGLFKRTKIESWETNLLINVFNKVSINDSMFFIRQINDGLLRGVLIGVSDIHGYVGFSYNSKVYNKFYDKNGRNFKFENIKVFDIKSNKYLNLSIYFSFGVINGYSVEKNGKYKLDISNINTDGVQKIYFDTIDYDKISKIFTPREKELLNPSEIYLVKLKDKDYYHLKDLEDGDFLGIDIDKNVYKITHDPFEINPLSDKLEEIL
ncbi:hypothetical protein GCM10008015_04920 [Flavobacterium palustre]|uniref:Uncharacterized protein n=1 Tax=Flavobacterium palustre TaxID=1476463 RepID=A0ABQ1H9Q8_9FLAO|nr:hypothetical protein [Flavobacterium palustre]GGA67203.1 hypothetical protein GCM10008015_04920 [Flavobacterium palustre]